MFPALHADYLLSEPPESPHFRIKKLLFDIVTAAATAKSLQSCLTLCDPIPGILQARTLEWVAKSFCNA